MTTSIPTVPIIKATGFVGKQGSGGSHPLLLRLEDGRVAHVKFQKNPQSTRSLINDLIGTVIGRYLDAPVAEAVFVDVRATMRAQVPYLTKYRWLPGLQFGTLYINNAIPIKKFKPYHDIANVSDLPLSALLETWLFNRDVKLSHILCIPEHNHARLMLVDHGFIFPQGPLWSIHDLKRHRRNFPWPNSLTWVARQTSSRFHFDDAVNRISTLSRDDLAAMINLVPAEWGLSSRRIKAIIDFLVYRQNKLENVAKDLETLWNRHKTRDDDIPLPPLSSSQNIKSADDSSSPKPTPRLNSIAFEEFSHRASTPSQEDSSLRFSERIRKSGSKPAHPLRENMP